MMLRHSQEHGSRRTSGPIGESDVSDLQTETTPDFQPISSRFAEAAPRIEGFLKELLSKLEAAKEEARQNAEAERLRHESMSSGSVQNGLNGQPLSPPGSRVMFEHARTLGRGRHAIVYAMKMQGSSQGSPELFAQKVIHCDSPARFKQMEEAVGKEVQAMTTLRHHHITSILFWSPIPEQSAFSIYMNPIGDYDLNAFLPSFSNQHDAWFGCLVAALTYAHECGIIHQDIKPSNIIIKANKPYLADFGSARDFSDSSISNDDIIRGTPNYLAPEDQSGEPRGRRTDIFSLGCVFAEMLTVRQGKKREDFDAQRRNSQVSDAPHAFRHNLKAVKDWLYNLEYSDENDKGICDTLVTMLRLNANRRPWPKTLLRDFQQMNMVCKDCQA